MDGGGQRNAVMAGRVERAPVRYPFSFVVAGDSGAWPDPTADGIFSGLLAQVSELDPPPIFFAQLGDFAGPGTAERHAHYLGLVAGLPVPDVCVVGNHDLDDASGPESFARVHGPTNFSFAYGHTRFVALHSQPGVTGEVEVRGADTAEGLEGPREEDLAFLDSTLAAAEEPHRVVLMHMPPHLGGRFSPHAEWGFRRRETEFLALLRARGVKLVCCAHGLAFDECVQDGIRFVMSGGGGAASAPTTAASARREPADRRTAAVSTTRWRSPSPRRARSRAASSRPSTARARSGSASATPQRPSPFGTGGA